MRAMLRWGRRGVWALMDQGLFATTNFVVSVWLARVLSVADFGVYALGSTVLLLVGAFFLGLLGEPISVFGSGKYRERFEEYLTATLVGWGIAAGLELGLFALAAAGLAMVGMTDFPRILVVVGVIAPLVSLLRTLRMCAYTIMRPGLAAVATALHLSLVVLAIGTIPAERVTPSVGFLTLGLGVVPAAVVLILAMSARAPWRIPRGLYVDTYRDHAEFGRWSVGANLLLWVPGNAVYFLLTSWSGVEAVGVLKALRTLTTPVMHAIYALTSVLMPKLVSVVGTPAHRRVARTGLLLFVGLALGYWVVIALAGEPLLDLAYSGGYGRFAGYLTALALGPVVSAVVAVLGASLRSMERPRDVFLGNSVAAGTTLGVGAILISQTQLWGAVATVVLAPLAAALVMAFLDGKARGASL